MSRIRDEAGFAMVLVVSITMLITLLPLAAMTAALTQLPLARMDQDRQAALGAADSGVEDYINRLNQNANYWQFTCPAVSPTCLSVAASPDNNQAFDLTKWQPVSPTTAAGFHYSVNNQNVNTYTATNPNPATSFGTLYLTSTGQSGKATRTIEVSLRQVGFLDSLSVSDINIVDPSMSPVAGKTVAYSTQHCSAYAYAVNSFSSTGFGPDPSVCAPLLNYWVSGQTLTGPLRSNDEYYINGTPVFNGPLGTADPTPADSPYWKNFAGGTPAPVFNQGKPINMGTISFPPSNAPLAVTALQGGCLYTGPTTIQLHDTRMDVTSPDSIVTNSTKPISNCVGTNLKLPTNGVLYVQSIPTSTTDPNYGPCYVRTDTWSSPAPTSPGDVCTAGDAFVQSTAAGMDGQLTINADNNIFITGSLTYSSFAGGDVLGLIANNLILINHPIAGVDNSGNVSFTPTGPGTPAPAITFPAVIKLPSGANGVTIDAAMLSVTHSLGTSNFGTGSLGQMVINGSIAGKYMDIEGTFNGSGLASGYNETYNYDARLAHLTPPFFLVPLQTTWARTSFSEIPTPSPGGTTTTVPPTTTTVPPTTTTTVPPTTTTTVPPTTTTTAPPTTVTGLAPPSSGQGAQSQTIVVTGTNFLNGAALASTITGNTGVTVNSTIYNSATQLTINLSVATNATVASNYGFSLTNGDGSTAAKTNAFSVTAAPTVTFPTTASLYNAGHNAGTETLHISGTGFQSGLTATANGAFAINSIGTVTSTSIIVTLTGSGGQNAKGSLTVTNPDGGTVTTTNSLNNGGSYNG